jgi:signal transduction histidine kinase
MTTEAGQQTSTKPALGAALAIATAVLTLDIYTPQEMPPQYLYVLCILLTIWLPPGPRMLWGMTALAIGLTILGAVMSPPTYDFYIILFNRSIAIILLLATALLVRGYRRTHDQLHRLNLELEARVEDRTRDLSRAFAEREQLNRDLHDDVLQSLYAVGLNLEAGPAAQPSGRIPKALQQLKATMQQIRSYIGGGPQQIADNASPLDAALPVLVQTMTPAQGPAFRLAMDSGIADGLSREQTDALLLIIREALSNCVRHARAREGCVTVHRHNGSLRIDIRDDGIGFDPATTGADHHGLANMGIRARSIGADFAVTSQPGRGASITLTLPLSKRSADS